MKKSRKLKEGRSSLAHVSQKFDSRLLPFVSRFACATSAAAAFASIAAGIFRSTFQSYSWGSCDPERVRVISIARLRTLPPMHLQPIDVIVFDDPCVEILS